MSIPDYVIFPVEPSPRNLSDPIYEKTMKTIRKRGIRGIREEPSVKVPDTLNLNKLLNPSRNQGRRGTCVAFSTCAMKEYQEKLDVNFSDYMSPDSIYFYRINKPGDGMFLNDAMDILTTKGIAPEIAFPYDSNTEPESVPNEAITIMQDFKINSYALVNTIGGVKEALYMHGPCLISFPVFDGINGQFWKATSPDIPCRGGHCVLIVGYTKDGFILRNSWGSTWNGDGTVIYPFADFGMHWEIWTSVDSDSPHKYPSQPWWKKLMTTCYGVCNK
jgi:hypothetical protein